MEEVIGKYVNDRPPRHDMRADLYYQRRARRTGFRTWARSGKISGGFSDSRAKESATRDGECVEPRSESGSNPETLRTSGPPEPIEKALPQAENRNPPQACGE